ncbi:phage holin [Carnobacteriaceae bacterium 52-44]
MKLNNKIYDVGKWIVLILLPALAVLINGLGELYGWVSTPTIVTTINLVTVFLGSILQVSSNKYNKNIERSGGEIDERNCS